jgi:peroxiredoxin
MTHNIKFIVFLGALIIAPATYAKPNFLRVQTPDTVFELRSVKQHGQVFVALEDVHKQFPLSITSDADATLLILASSLDCVPIYMLDKEEAVVEDSEQYVRWDLVANAMGDSSCVQKNVAKLANPFSSMAAVSVGFEVGNHAAGFALKNEKDSLVTFVSLNHNQAVLLLFVRSGAWDPQSKWILRNAQTRLDSLRGAGIAVAAIHGYERREAAKWAKDLRVTYPLLFDPFSAVMRVYGVFDQGHLPHSAIFFIDKNGIIRLRQVFDNPDEFPDFNVLMSELAKTLQ